MALPDAPSVAERIANALEAGGIPYAVGGAVALARWAPPRATHDVDINVFTPIEKIDLVFDALDRAGCTVDRDAARARAAERADFIARYQEMRIDVFMPFDPVHDEIRRRRVSVTLPSGRQLWVLSAEDLTVFKTVFGRPKDRLDVERLAAVQGARLDGRYVLQALRVWLPESDRRLDETEALFDRFGVPRR